MLGGGSAGFGCARCPPLWEQGGVHGGYHTAFPAWVLSFAALLPNA